MSEPAMPWADLLAWSDGHGLLAKRLYVVLSEPVTGLKPVLDNLDEHVAYQTRLENEGDGRWSGRPASRIVNRF